MILQWWPLGFRAWYLEGPSLQVTTPCHSQDFGILVTRIYHWETWSSGAFLLTFWCQIRIRPFRALLEAAQTAHRSNKTGAFLLDFSVSKSGPFYGTYRTSDGSQMRFLIISRNQTTHMQFIDGTKCTNTVMCVCVCVCVCVCLPPKWKTQTHHYSTCDRNIFLSSLIHKQTIPIKTVFIVSSVIHKRQIPIDVVLESRLIHKIRFLSRHRCVKLEFNLHTQRNLKLGNYHNRLGFTIAFVTL